MTSPRRRGALLAGGLLAASTVAGALHYRHRPAPTPPATVTPASTCTGAVGLVGPVRADEPTDVVALGRRLFEDRRLSADGSVSCATCHRPERAFTDGRARAVGIAGRVGRRNSPQLFNLADAGVFGWDGRAPVLDDAIRAALTNPAEMGMTDDGLSGALRAEAPEFQRILGARLDTVSVSRAIAAYVGTLRTSGSRADRFLYCGDGAALDEAERNGLRLFAGRAHCVRCHVFEHENTTPLGGRLALFTDNRFHNLSVGAGDDPGRAAVTGRSEDTGAFKTPTLRNVAITGPYMHDGSLATLEAVIDFYNDGGGRRAGVDPAVVPLGLDTRERHDLVAFLRALTSADARGLHLPPPSHPTPSSDPGRGGATAASGR